jgi:hypothetical protein
MAAPMTIPGLAKMDCRCRQNNKPNVNANTWLS